MRYANAICHLPDLSQHQPPRYDLSNLKMEVWGMIEKVLRRGLEIGLRSYCTRLDLWGLFSTLDNMERDRIGMCHKG